ncbi:monovalent cation/H(+) antiporter subunit G [Microbacterium indicum]|uniref:monovalent cation/H(+) antiporter subunit G n=1 Tax=Microbacterium indicum TaxID=358100 RepID=UPI000421B106|nr:monovalent cation/H(+) antiporter subunit G [Microbacterium indicum]
MMDGFEIAALVLVLLGAILCLTAAIGLLRFRDVPSRLHAATKPQILGLLVIAIGVELALRTWTGLAFLIPIVLIQMATAPLSAHMVGRQAHRNGTIDRENLLIDELADDDRDDR